VLPGHQQVSLSGQGQGIEREEANNTGSGKIREIDKKNVHMDYMQIEKDIVDFT